MTLPHGKLSETTREEIGSPGSEKREEMPASGFLGPDRTYPIVELRDGKWQVTRKMLEAAEKRAVSQSEHGIAERAKKMLAEKFGARDELLAGMRSKFSSPKAVMAALGLDEALLGSNAEVDMAKLTRGSALYLAERLRASGKLAQDVSLDEVAEYLQNQGMPEGDRRVDDDANAGLPPFLAEHKEDADDSFETEEERREDEAADRRAKDAKDRMGRDETEEEGLRREEEEEFKPDLDDATDRHMMRADDRRRADDRKRARDAMRAKRAADAKARLGRDESEEERERREREDEAEDRRRARDRIVADRAYRHARDRHRRAMDAMRKHADDYRKATDAKRADDAKRHADDAKRCYDAVCDARDARMRAADARRRMHADDRRRADDAMKMPHAAVDKMVSKAAMDAAIASAIRDNDAKHTAISAAIEFVRPKVGKIAMDASIQNEGDVYARALDILGEAHDGITQTSALRRMFEMARRPGGDERGAREYANDSVPKAGSFDMFREFFPGAASIERM